MRHDNHLNFLPFAAGPVLKAGALGARSGRVGREIDVMLASVTSARGTASVRRSCGRQGSTAWGGRRLNFVRACASGDAGHDRGRPFARARGRGDQCAHRRARAIDLTAAVERHRTEGDRLLVSAAPGPDGIVRRMDVRAREGNTNWAVFALANSGDEQIDRLIVVPHYRMVGSGVFWPDLGLSRVASITSSGERPDRQDSATADIFRITLDPGSVMTYVLELRTGQAQPALSVGARTPTRTRSTASRSTTASSSALPACWRCS